MIDLNRKRHIQPIADDWLRWVKDYFFTVKSGNQRPSKKIPGGRKTFDTYASKLNFELEEIITTYSNGHLFISQRGKVLLRWAWLNFDKIIMASPAQLEIWIKNFRLRSKSRRPLIKMIEDVMVPYYEAISKKYGFNLVEALHIKTCPYCNRAFIYSYEGIRRERPELDHFYPKAAFPMFCLSFYNLIPVCHSCNHVKLEDEIGVNPYAGAFSSRFVITDKTGAQLSKSKIYHLTEKEILLQFENPTAKEKENIRVLGLEDVYNKHTDYVKELIDKTMAYDTHAREALVSSFQGAGYNPRQVFDFVWGRHLMTAEFEDRPLSKLTKEVLEQVGIKKK